MHDDHLRRWWLLYYGLCSLDDNDPLSLAPRGLYILLMFACKPLAPGACRSVVVQQVSGPRQDKKITSFQCVFFLHKPLGCPQQGKAHAGAHATSICNLHFIWQLRVWQHQHRH